MNKSKILLGCFFVIAGFLVGATFVTATTYFQLIIGTLLYPLLIIIFLVAFPRKVRIRYSGGSVTTSLPPVGPAANEAAKGKNVGIIDIDKRSFLKLIGGAGIAFFLFSVFRNKIEGLFFKNLPVPATGSLQNISNTKIDGLAHHEPMDGYTISEVDDSITAFYGFINNDNSWFIMEEDAEKGSFRYARGASNFPGNWANRTNLKYDYYNNVFKL